MQALAPLILTAEFEEPVFDWFDELRRQHFPPGRNVVPAHLTLFHALPGEQETAVRVALDAETSGAHPPEAEATGLRNLGRGVAYTVAAPTLASVRVRLAEQFAPWLTRQDQAAFRPHVTIQNKVEPQQARALLAALQSDFQPFAFRITALRLWRYLGGPWGAAGRFPFGPADAG